MFLLWCKPKSPIVPDGPSAHMAALKSQSTKVTPGRACSGVFGCVTVGVLLLHNRLYQVYSTRPQTGLHLMRWTSCAVSHVLSYIL